MCSGAGDLFSMVSRSRRFPLELMLLHIGQSIAVSIIFELVNQLSRVNAVDILKKGLREYDPLAQLITCGNQ